MTTFSSHKALVFRELSFTFLEINLRALCRSRCCRLVWCCHLLSEGGIAPYLELEPSRPNPGRHGSLDPRKHWGGRDDLNKPWTLADSSSSFPPLTDPLRPDSGPPLPWSCSGKLSFHFLVDKLNGLFSAFISLEFLAALDTANHTSFGKRRPQLSGPLCSFSSCLPSCFFSGSIPPFS